jgi:CRP-like cAMP-binding protein
MALPDDLTHVTLFAGLDRRQLAALARLATTRTARRGQTLFRAGDPADGFFAVRTGRIKLYRMTADGRQQVLHVVGPGEVFGEAAVFTGETFPAYAEALAETRLLHVPKTAFLDAVTRDPQLALNLLATLSQRLRRFAELIEELSLRAVSSRLAQHLVQRAEAAGRRVPAGIRVELDSTKTDLAARLGTVSETLSRSLARFRDLGLVEVRGRAITLRDLGALRELAGRKG